MKKGVKKMGLQITIVVLTAIIACCVVLFLVSGIFQVPKYLEPWSKNYASKFDDPRIKLVAHGLLAANGHNMQPWKIKLDKENEDIFYLYVDTNRMTPAVDPDSRQLMVTQGTFLEYVKIAGNKLGYNTEITLFPNDQYDENNIVESMKKVPVAKVKLNKKSIKSDSLYDYMFLSDTNRSAYSKDKLTEAEVSTLQNDDYPEINTTIFQDTENKKKLGQYAIDSAIVEASVKSVMQETNDIFRANEYEKNKYRYGFSVEGQGTSGLMKHIMQGLVTLFPSLNKGKASANLFIKSTKTSVQNTPAYVMIISNDNSRISQVRSGMVYSKLILQGHDMDLVMQPLSQVLEEYSEMTNLYDRIHRDYAPDGSTIQMLVRIGKTNTESPKSMRRDVMELIK